MADVMKKITFLKVVEYVEGANYFAVTCDEARTNDNQLMICLLHICH
jgi:DNA-binding IscR family transcriptional regulator